VDRQRHRVRDAHQGDDDRERTVTAHSDHGRARVIYSDR